MTRAEEFVARMGWEYKRVEGHNGPQILIKICPYCHDSKYTHFYLADTYNGPFVCHKCQIAGSLDDLMEHVKDIRPVRASMSEDKRESMSAREAALFYVKAHTELMTNQSYSDLLSWLVIERKISLAAIKQMRIGARENYGKKWICFPYWVGDEVHCSKERTISKDFVYLYYTDNKGGPLYNQDVLSDSPGSVVITEGEMDTLSLLSLGFKRVVSVSNGSNYINSNWLPILKDIKKIYLGYDGDDKGRMGATNFAKQLGLDRCYRLPFGVKAKDANEFISQYDIDYRDSDAIARVRRDFVEQFIKPAKPIDIEGVIEISSVLHELASNTDLLEQSDIDTPWSSINHLIERGGFSGGDLIVTTANPGIGKTNWALNIFHHLTKKEIPALFYELEFPPRRLVKRLVCLDQKTSQVTVESLMKAHSDLGNLPMYFGYRAGSLDLKKAMETIRAAFNRYTLQFVVFDHVHFLVRSIRYETQEISLAAKSFKDLAVELDIPILLIAHLSKLPREGRNIRREPDAEDLRGSKMLWADADLVFLLHREKSIQSDARNLLESKFHTLKRKNPGLISADDLMEFANDGRLGSLKGVGDKTQEEIIAAIERVGIADDIVDDVYSPETKVILQKNRFGPGGVRSLLYDGARASFVQMDKR